MPIRNMKPAHVASITSLLMITSLITACGGGGGGAGTPAPPAALSSNADLSALTMNSIAFDQAFATAVLDYTAGASFTTKESRVNATVADPGARVAVNGTPVNSGSDSDIIPLEFGSNVISVSVTAANGTTVREYKINVTRRGPADFIQTAYVKASNSQSNDAFGYSVDVSGDGETFVVGAWGEDSLETGVNGNEANDPAPDLEYGAVYIFRRSASGSWSQEAYLKASNTSYADNFGVSVAISGNGTTVAVGADAEDGASTGVNGNQNSAGATNSGAVYVFTRDGTGIWSQQAYIKASNTDARDFFGSNIDLSNDGSTLAITAEYEWGSAIGVNGNDADNSAQESGAAYVFARDPAGVWTQQAYVKASNTTATDYFGRNVALSGDGATLAVSSLDDSRATGVNGDQNIGGAEFSGAVFVFTRDTGGVWTQEAYIKASNTGIDDLFGYALALSEDGSSLAASSYLDDSLATGIGGDDSDNSASDAGAVFLFTKNSGLWSQHTYIKASNTDAGDTFGTDVDISSDGKILAVSAVRERSNATGVNGDEANNSLNFAGAVYIFSLQSTGNWKQQAYVKASNTGVDDSFGSAISLSGDGTVLSVGAWTESSAATGINGDEADNSSQWSGATYIFEL